MLAEQIAASIEHLGVEETASIMGRALAYMAYSSGNDLEFDCALAVVTIERKEVIPSG
jgi:hypothetical protein